MSGLNDRQRRALANLVTTARSSLYQDAQRTLRGTYGILPDGTFQGEAGLAPDLAVRARRRTLEGVLAYLRAEGASAKGAVERLTREVAFTHLNRLLAIRIADALGILAPSLRDASESAGFRQWVDDLAPLLASSDDTGGYWTYLSQCADELAIDAPALFDPRNPLLALRPSKGAFDATVALFADPDYADLWSADDTFGWAYQFFNTKEERQQMRAESTAPRDSWELAVRNQFFTPTYVVRFLVQNTLGRRLVEADPQTPLLDQLDLLVDPPTARSAPLDLAQVRVLDPACGSGHFLLGCYDILEAAWALHGVPPERAAPSILPCLWGVDIDPRAVQVAQTALVFRARRACGHAPLPPPNIVCAQALPEDPAAWENASVGLDPDVRHLIHALRAPLRDAPVLGPLLKAEQLLSSQIRSTVIGADDTANDLFAAAGIARDNFGNAERAVIAALQHVADSSTAGPAERLFAASATDAVKFVEAVRNRYDAVLMNPPFGEPVPLTKEYLKASYPWIPTKDYNLFAAFVGRGIELCKPEGYLGTVTSRAGMFLKTFEAWRNEVLFSHSMVTLADLGMGVMEEALVEAVAYVLSPRQRTPERAGVYIRLLRDADRPGGLAAAVAADRRGEQDRRVFHVPIHDFACIPGSPVAYWMGDPLRRLFIDLPRLEGNGAEVRVGLQTGDDFRFVRLFWEAEPRRIARTREETHQGKRWVPFAKGGEYSPYWADIHLVVDWGRDGEAIRAYAGSRPQNTQYFFRPGLTWSERTTSGFGPRLLPAGTIFSNVGNGCFPHGNPLITLAFLNSRLVRALMDYLTSAGEATSSGTAARHYSVGVVQSLPWPTFGDRADGLAASALSMVHSLYALDESDETTSAFAWPDISPGARGIRQSSALSAARRWHRAESQLATVDQTEEDIEDLLGVGGDVASELDEESLPVPTRYADTAVSDVERNDLIRVAALPTDALVDEVVSRSGGHRELATKSYFADRRIELLCHFLHRPPGVIRDILEINGSALDVGEEEKIASALISFLVGVAFGRWDARGPRPARPFDPFAPVPLCPRAMLVGDDGLPTTVAPPGYPLPIPPDGILVDEPGHPLDLTAAVEAAARVALPNGEGLLADSISVLGHPSLREYLAQAFFKEHLGRYSKSRRQAPVYWQLTTTSGAWSAWLYAARFSREMLYAVVTLAERRLALATERARAFQEDQTLSMRQRQAAVERERTIAGELEVLRHGVARLAGLGWQPDLEDGYVLCAAPLAEFFPKNTWKQLAKNLAEIGEGAYPWAGVHEYREAL